MEDVNENTKNLYVIKRRLAELKLPNYAKHFTYYVGSYMINIFSPDDKIVTHETLSIALYEEVRAQDADRTYKVSHAIDLERDTRFRNYKPIKYSDIPYGSNGHNIPLMTLCELIKYLHRLSNLAVFS